jgi:hypothetical protein
MRRLWLAIAVLAVTAAPAGAQDRYSLAGGCFAAQGVAGAEQVRMQATTLGRYLLYRPDGTFVAANGEGGVAPAAQPSPAADWRVEESGGGAFTLTPQSGAPPVHGVRFTSAAGCAEYPEAPLSASGRPRPAPVGYRSVGGIVEGHMHWMTFEYIGGNFHCGRPWHPYGIP